MGAVAIGGTNFIGRQLVAFPLVPRVFNHAAATRCFSVGLHPLGAR